MKTEIWNKALKLCIVKPCEANILIKHLLGDGVMIDKVIYFTD